MVLHTVSETETPPLTPPPPPMASSTFSAKSKPLHNFPLSNLKWTMNHPNAHRLRTRLPDPAHEPHRPLSPHHHQPHSPRKLGDSGLNPVLRFGSPPNPTENSSGSGDSGPDEPGSDGGAGKGGFTVEKPVEPVEISEKKVDGKGKGPEGEGKSKILIRFPGRSRGSGYATDAGDEAEAEADGDAEFSFEDEEPSFHMVKTWNLRPRKAVTKPPNPNNGGGSRNGGPPAQPSRPRPAMAPAPSRTRAAPEEKAAVAQKRQVFSVSLTKEEIEEDFVRLTGARPPKKPKKRARVVQKQLDGGFPGLWLTTVTPDLYKVPDPPLKG